MDKTWAFFTRPAFLLVSLLLLKCKAKSHASPQNVQNQCVAVEAASFMELVDKSHAFVDKTLFIKDFLEPKLFPPDSVRAGSINATEVIRITYPRKWGRTMNMKMIENFLQMEVDESGNQISPKETAAYRLFALGKTASGHDVRLNIASHQHIIDKYLAQHPVIYVSFKNVTGSTYDEIFENMKQSVAETFKKHAYMTKVFQNALKSKSATDEVRRKAKDNLEKFQAILSSTVNNFDALKSLSLLSCVLQDHFGKKVFVLLDDHDQPLLTLLHQNATSLNVFKQSREYLTHFLENSLTFCQDKHCEKVLIHGVVKVPQIEGDRRTYPRHFAEFSVVRNKFANHYGFDQDEVSVLFKKCGIDTILAGDAQKWYKGFTMNKAQYIDVFNPFDVSTFAYTGKISNYWAMSGVAPFAPYMFKYTLVESFVLSLLNKETATIESDDLGCSTKELEELATALNPSLSVLSSPLSVAYKAKIYYEYLLMTGYLTLNKSTESLAMAHVRIPNEEIAAEMASLMVQHYRDAYSVSYVVMNQLAEELKRLLKSKDSVTFKRSLDVFFSSFPAFFYKLRVNNDVINSAFNMFALIAKGIYHFNCEIYLLKDGGENSANPNSRPNVVLNFEKSKVMIIIQLTFNLSSKKALTLANTYLNIVDHKEIRLAGLIGINVFPNKTVDINEFWGEKKK